ncbi:hypothetical protein [Rosistilla oblonga]|uniref:hypothetical protein n=1 Tax=Rosistilla oblonga TaxID=2527990 RepID=UPI003A984388
MDHVRHQVARVRRRLMLQKFASIFCWSLFAALCIALLALAVPKLWALSFDLDTWRLSWLAAAVTAAVVIAGVVTRWTAPSMNDAAIAIDQQFGLKERISSSLSMSEAELDSEIGKALLADAARRAEKLDVSEHFRHRVQRIALLPLAPCAVMAVLLFIPDATQDNQAQASVDTASQQQIKTAADELKKKLAVRRKRAEAQGLKDAGDLFKKIEADLDQLSQRKDMNQKQAMVALNDIKKQLQERRDQMGSKEEMRKQLAGLKDMQRGPADKLASAMQRGELGKAEDEIKKLVKKLNDGTMTKAEQKQLENQIAKMQEAIEKAVEKHEQAKQDLQKKIDQAKQEGRSEDAEKLEKELQQMQQMDQQMQQMQQMAEGLAQAKEAMQKGDASSAAESLEQLAEELGEMQNEMDQLEEMMDQLSQTKQQMRCQSCQGNGCQQCQGSGQFPGSGGDKGEGGDGMGEGEGGKGDRPEEETETGNYESQVRTKPKNGSGIAAGFANGPNRKGVTREEIKSAVINAMQEESDPLEDRPLPRAEREHTEQYFNQLRQGSSEPDR